MRQTGSDRREQTEPLILLESLPAKALPPSNVQVIDQPTTEDVSNQREDPEVLSLFSKYWVFSGLILTTLISSLLLTGNVRRWTVSNEVYEIVRRNRGSTQLVVQVFSNALGLLHVTIITVLINYSTRLRLASIPTSLDTLGLWNIMLRRSLDFQMPLHFLAMLVVFIAICITPSALWAGALTPISVSVLQSGEILLPTYSNMSLLQYNSTQRLGLPSFQSTKGTFAYNVGEFFLGPLLYSASTATTVDGSVRQHAKLDFSRFSFMGRSYGIGSSVGLLDDNILQNPLATQYTFQEEGYNPVVKCIYNASSEFFLDDNTGEKKIYRAYGYLPNSNGSEEYARYAGFGMDAIVAIGVASKSNSVGRIFGIASGSLYPLLNNTQCTIDFKPNRFNVTVNTNDRNITVTPLDTLEDIKDIEPSGFLTFIANWQFTLMSTDLTSFYSSLIGNSIDASVTNHIRSTYNSTSLPLDKKKEATLAGLENSVTAMIDDILGMYASCQLMVANNSKTTPGFIRLNAFQIGEIRYIIAITVFNVFLILVVIVEAVRTRGWKTLIEFDYMDPRDLVIWSSRGGQGVAKAVDLVEIGSGDDREGQLKAKGQKRGDVSIIRNGWQIDLAQGGSKRIQL